METKIKNEKHLQIITDLLCEKDNSIIEKNKFSSIVEKFLLFLKKQESDLALTSITFSAIDFWVSDIHYEKYENKGIIRFRIDGQLETICSLTEIQYKLIIERLKYKSNLKLNITHIPQDGKYRIDEDKRIVDVRISTLPTPYGENVVCRILDSTKETPPLEKLGFMWTAKRIIEKNIYKKNGMILVTGPTGSGKTTSLYSMLDKINTPENKIITLEDPIEYQVPGIVQSEVQEKNGYTYKNGLKALLRQDPDVIMVGEIRDLETANIAIQASLTGHLVLSTLHTKSSIESLERLLNMWVAGFNIAASMDVIIAQRLVKKVCKHCAVKRKANDTEAAVIDWVMKDIGLENLSYLRKKPYEIMEAKWCEKCGNTGYKGRVGLYEVFHFTDKIRTMIRKEESVSEILKEARKADFITMREDGVLKVLKKMTTISELFRVID